MKSNTVDCCVTSPPYYALRDYGMPGQLGLEPSPFDYVRNITKIFREVRRVLKPQGSLWLNLGDSYVGSGKGGGGGGKNDYSALQNPSNRTKSYGLKNKDLIGVPWRVAFALQNDGWYLRQDIIWSKLNTMPESMRDRCTKAHEYIFLLSKEPNYYFDYKAIQEEAKQVSIDRVRRRLTGNEQRGFPGGPQNHMSRFFKNQDKDFSKRHKRSVWTLPSSNYKGAHFATFPEKLIEPCILAGCPEGGIVLDPFFGSGTTGVVSLKNKRKYLGVELNPEYIKLAEKRIAECS